MPVSTQGNINADFRTMFDMLANIVQAEEPEDVRSTFQLFIFPFMRQMMVAANTGTNVVRNMIYLADVDCVLTSKTPARCAMVSH